MDDDVEKCAHPSCRCRKGEDGDYCSVYCRDAGDLTELQCSCGHDECSL
jgi:hypothetical protein